MTTHDDNTKKPLGIASGSKLGLSVNKNVVTNEAPFKSRSHKAANVIIVTKGRSAGSKPVVSSETSSNPIKEGGIYSEIPEANTDVIIKSKKVIAPILVAKPENEKVLVVQDEIVTNEEVTVDLVDQQTPEEQIQNRSERSSYIRDLTLSKGKVRNLNQINTKPEVVAAVSIDEPTVISTAENKDIDGSVKKAALIGSKKKPGNNFSDDKDPPLVVKKAAIANDSKRLNRQSSNKGSLSHFVIMEGDDDDNAYRKKFTSSVRKNKYKKNKSSVQLQDKVFREVLIPDFISVQELSNRMTEKASDLIKSLMKMGVMVTVNQSIDADIAELVVLEFGHRVKRVTDAEFEKSFIQDQSDSEELLEAKAPVVTIMGHVDHGKTSLLDALRLTDVVAKEAGGITQHIGAYNVTLSGGRSITFLDTPGHEAFTAMRMRGADVTDIVVLVVAADDGIKEQTVEAINHAKAAKVPIIVAINKIDKPDSNPDRVKNELLSHDIVPEDMGGDVMVINVSARTKLGLDQLEEAILSQAEILDLRSNPHAKASGAVIEASMDKSRGAVATLLVQRGTLRIGDIIVVGVCYGKVKNLLDDKGLQVKSSGPAMAVEVLGLNQTPMAGDVFSVVDNENVAKELIDFRINKAKEKKIFSARKDSLEKLFTKAIDSSSHRDLSIIVKADVNGSVEAICSSLLKIVHDEITIRILHSGVGGITESDITLAAASRALVVGFNVRANNQAKDMARQLDVDIKYYSIIYNLLDDIKAAASGMLSPTVKEKVTGYAEIRQVFDLTKFGKVAGCNTTEGMIYRNSHARLIRDSIVVHEGKLKALKRFKEDVKEVKAGFECGISFERYEDMKVGDKIEAFLLVEEARQL